MLLIWVLSSAGLKIQWPYSASLICVIGIITILKNGYFWRQVWYRQRITPWRDIWHEIDFLYPHFLEKGRTEVYHTGGYMEGVSREQAHLSRQETEKDREKKKYQLERRAFLVNQGRVHSRGHKGISLVHLNVTRSHSGEVKKNLWQELSLSSRCTWSPEQDAHSLFVVPLGKHEVLKIYDTQSQCFHILKLTRESFITKCQCHQCRDYQTRSKSSNINHLSD